MSFPSDLDIARAAARAPLADIAAQMGIGPHLLERYGDDVAKVRLDAIDELSDRPTAKYVVVTAITPTPLGEGKTTTTVGVGMAMKHIGKRAVISLRQPSMGPTFGIKGGAGDEPSTFRFCSEADATLKGAPAGHTLNVREARGSVSAGFVYPICGDMTVMPGLSSAPAASIIDFDDDGEIVGLS